MSIVHIEGPISKIIPATIGGTPHPILIDWWTTGKGLSNTKSFMSLLTGTAWIEVDSTALSQALVYLLLSEGFSVTGAAVFLKMSPETYDTEVPEGISNRIHSDTDTVKKWSEWHDDYHSHIAATDGDKIVPGNSFGIELTSDELLILLLSGFQFYLGHEIVNLLQTQDVI